MDPLGVKKHRQIANDRDEFQKMLDEVPSDAFILMEATGTYYFNVALFLHRQGRFVSVVNPMDQALLRVGHEPN